MYKKLSALSLRTELLALTLIIAAGTALRFLHLTTREFWYDEAYTGLLIQNSWHDMLQWISIDVHPPLYYSALKLWTSVFGVSDFGIRSFSAMSGILTLPLIYGICKEILVAADQKLRSWIPLLLTAVIAVDPFFVWYSQEARTYAWLWLWFAILLWSLLRAIRTSPHQFSRYWLTASFAITAGFLSHYIFTFVILTLVLFLVWHWKRKTIRLQPILITFIFPLAGFLAWLPSLWHQLSIKTSVFWIPRAEFSFIPKSLTAFLFGVDAHALGVPPVIEVSTIFRSESIGLCLFVFILILLALLILRPRVTVEIRQRLLWIFYFAFVPICLIVLASWAGYNFYIDRYLGIFGLLCIIFLGVNALLLNPKWGTVLVLVYVVFALLRPLPGPDYGYRTVMSTFAHSSDTRLVTTDPFDFLILKYYASQEPQTTRPQILVYNKNNTDHYDTWGLILTSEVVQQEDALKAADVVVTHTKPSFETRTLTQQETVGSFSIYSL